MSYSAAKEWSRHFLKSTMAYPSEYVIRIFKGSYPRLQLSTQEFNGKKLCDVGCGDGRNLAFLAQCGLQVYGVEIADSIVEKVAENLKCCDIKAEIKTGSNQQIPFANEAFDYLLSWNACYYMGDSLDFDAHVEEFSRVLHPRGFVILSIPKKSCFIYKNSEKTERGCRIITADPFGARNGAVLRMFENETEIERTFSPFFENFTFASIHDDCFGLEYHWHIVIAQKRGELWKKL